MKPKLAVHFVCMYTAPTRWRCFGILNNGFVFGEKLCSKPAFAPLDLYFSNVVARDTLYKAFGLTLEDVQKNNYITQVDNLNALIERVATLHATNFKRAKMLLLRRQLEHEVMLNEKKRTGGQGQIDQKAQDV